MKQQILQVISNKKLNTTTYEMILGGQDLMHKSGQFLELSLNNFFLRRPFSIADCSENTVTLLYKVIGEGTKALSGAKRGDSFDCLTNLGNGFNSCRTQKPLLLGGGIGIAPLYKLAKDFVKKDIVPTILLGFRNCSEMFYLEEFKKLGDVIVATDDGSFGCCGNIVEALKLSVPCIDYYYACGPVVMLKALQNHCINGELSLEARMGCGFGVCMGCSIQTKNGYKRVCKEGPIFDASEVLW